MNTPEPIVLAIDLAVPPEAAFEAFTRRFGDWWPVQTHSLSRVRFSWHPGREPASAQWIDVTFAAVAGGSRATLTHGGWEALGEIGPLLRQEYVPGWRQVFGQLFAEFASDWHWKKKPRRSGPTAAGPSR